LSFPDEPPRKIEDLLKPLKKFPNNTVKRKTIGPKDTPDPFTAKAFMDLIMIYLSQSDSLGWIKTKETFNKYNFTFEKAKTRLEQNDNPASIAILDSVLTNVEAEKDNTLTSEAYALIKYNTEYLKDQLLLKSKK
jgi:hypothetical protein